MQKKVKFLQETAKKSAFGTKKQSQSEFSSFLRASLLVPGGYQWISFKKRVDGAGIVENLLHSLCSCFPSVCYSFGFLALLPLAQNL